MTGLAPGIYTVTVNSATLPPGYNTTPTNGPVSRTYSVPAGSDVLHADFGFNAPAGTTGSIGDTVYLDTDGDSTKDAGEAGIARVSLILVDASNNIVATTTTAADGSYDFVGVPAGTYTVAVTDTFGVLSGLNVTQSDGGPIVLAAGGDHNDADFGYAPSGGTGTVGTIVWHDLNGNGFRDAGEPGMELVTLELWHDVDGNGVLDLGIDNLICVIAEPTLETADAIFSHRDVALICVTGGPMVARAALNSGKRAIVAGPGNPPVVVDETADLDNAARSIIQGGAYDNNLLCIAEKEVFVVESVFDQMMQAMERAGAMRLNSQEIERLI